MATMDLTGPPPTPREPRHLVHQEIMNRAFGMLPIERRAPERKVWTDDECANFAAAFGDENEAVPEGAFGAEPAPAPEVGADRYIRGESVTCKPRLPEPGLVSFEPRRRRAPQRPPERPQEAPCAPQPVLPTEEVMEWLEGLEEPLTPLELAEVTGAALPDVKLALWNLRMAGRVITVRRRRLAGGEYEWSYPGSFWLANPLPPPPAPDRHDGIDYAMLEAMARRQG